MTKVVSKRGLEGGGGEEEDWKKREVEPNIP